MKRESADPVHIRRYLFALAAGWTMVICTLLIWHLYSEWQETTMSAREGAVAGYQKDLLYRRWNARHGGVYVYATEDTPPNPYLRDVLERDIVTPSGRLLTMVNPAYMTRQVHEMSRGETIVQGHLASLTPVNPSNRADPWEAQALKSIAGGLKEVCAKVEVGGRRYLRLMRPLVAEAACLSCHAAQGCKQGDIRGGISVSVDMTPYEAMARARMLPISFAYAGLWVVGTGGIVLGSRGLRKRILAQVKQQRDHEFHLQIAQTIQERFYRTTAVVQGLDVAGVAMPATATGGDYFDFIQTPDGSLLMAIGDVSGHGFGSALVMAETRAYVRSHAQVESDVGFLLTEVNRRLTEDLEGSQLVTLFLARLEPGNHCLRYAGAGHLPGYLLSPEGEVRAVMNSSGPPAAVFAEAEFTSSEPVYLEDGAILLLLTDGVTESANGDEVEFGAESAIKFVQRNFRKTAAEIVEGICNAAREYNGGKMQQDDITCVVVKAGPLA